MDGCTDSMSKAKNVLQKSVPVHLEGGQPAVYGLGKTVLRIMVDGVQSHDVLMGLELYGRIHYEALWHTQIQVWLAKGYFHYMRCTTIVGECGGCLLGTVGYVRDRN